MLCCIFIFMRNHYLPNSSGFGSFNIPVQKCQKLSTHICIFLLKLICSNYQCCVMFRIYSNTREGTLFVSWSFLVVDVAQDKIFLILLYLFTHTHISNPDTVFFWLINSDNKCTAHAVIQLIKYQTNAPADQAITLIL